MAVFMALGVLFLFQLYSHILYFQHKEREKRNFFSEICVLYSRTTVNWGHYPAIIWEKLRNVGFKMCFVFYRRLFGALQVSYLDS